MKSLFHELKFKSRDSSVRSNGRNGTAQTHGIAASVYMDRGVDTVEGPLVDVVTLIPITSYGDWQNCHIDIPLVDFLELADLVRERIYKGGLYEIPTVQADRQTTDQPNV